MKSIFLIAILLLGLLLTRSIAYQVTASVLTDQSHPELVSGPSEVLATVTSSALPETTISASVNSSIEATLGDTAPVAPGNFFTNNWGALLMGLLGFADLVARLTPSEKDNSIINFLISIFNAIIPNLKKGGGSF